MVSARNLPGHIAHALDKLMVDRRGEAPDSFMITEDIVGHVDPGALYRLAPDRLEPAGSDAVAPRAAAASATPPAHVRVAGVWDDSHHVEATSSANILGGTGTLAVDTDAVTVPEAPPTQEALGFYGARLVAHGETLAFEADQSLPVTLMDIGAGYVPGYLHVESLGGGSFVEYHDRPHLHMPLDADARGHLLLGKRDGEDYLLSAFPIPFGYAIYTPPMALHADPYLVGRYLVIYSVTENFSTVVFRNPEGRVAEAHITA